MTLLIIYFLVAIVVSFFCSLLESVLLSLSIAHVTVLEKDGTKVGKIMGELKGNINRPLAAILTINTVANTVGAAGVGAQTHIIFGNEWVALASGILTLGILIFSEIIPKTIGSAYNKSLVPFSAYAIKGLMIIAWPFVVISENVSKIFTTKNPLSLKSEIWILVTASSSFSGKIPLGLSGKKEDIIFIGMGKSPTKVFLLAELSIQILINSISSLLS